MGCWTWRERKSTYSAIFEGSYSDGLTVEKILRKQKGSESNGIEWTFFSNVCGIASAERRDLKFRRWFAVKNAKSAAVRALSLLKKSSREAVRRHFSRDGGRFSRLERLHRLFHQKWVIKMCALMKRKGKYGWKDWFRCPIRFARRTNFIERYSPM